MRAEAREKGKEKREKEETGKDGGDKAKCKGAAAADVTTKKEKDDTEPKLTGAAAAPPHPSTTEREMTEQEKQVQLHPTPHSSRFCSPWCNFFSHFSVFR